MTDHAQDVPLAIRHQRHHVFLSFFRQGHQYMRSILWGLNAGNAGIKRSAFYAFDDSSESLTNGFFGFFGDNRAGGQEFELTRYFAGGE